jgi:hypothetical protein
VDIRRPRTSRKANPRLSTLHEVEEILRRASEREALPLSFAEIGRRMRAKRTRPEVIRVAVEELERHRLVAVGSKGVMWVAAPRAVRDQPTEPLA